MYTLYLKFETYIVSFDFSFHPGAYGASSHIQGRMLTKFAHAKFFREEKGWADPKILQHWRQLCADEKVHKDADPDDGQQRCFSHTETYIDLADIMEKEHKMTAGQKRIEKPKNEDFRDYMDALNDHPMGANAHATGVAVSDLADKLGVGGLLDCTKDLRGNMPTDDEFKSLLAEAVEGSTTASDSKKRSSDATSASMTSDGTASLKKKCKTDDEDVALALTAHRGSVKAMVEKARADLLLVEAGALAAIDQVKNERDKHPEELRLLEWRLQVVKAVQSEDPDYEASFNSCKERIVSQNKLAVDFDDLYPLVRFSLIMEG